MRRAERLREHARSLMHMAEKAGREDRACLASAAKKWMRAAENLERLERHPPGMKLPSEDRAQNNR